MQLPLTTQTLSNIKHNIKRISETFQTRVIPVGHLTRPPAERGTIEMAHWPIEQAIDLFVKEGAMKRSGSDVEIVNSDYFGISFAKLELPITFSIDKRIEVDLKIMGGLYVAIYDIENRLRYFLEERLIVKFGSSFIPSMPLDVQNSIAREKSNARWHIAESRTRELNFTNFSDLIKIVEMPNLLPQNKLQKELVEKLKYLSEVRTRVDHNNIIPSDDVQKTKDYIEQVKRIIDQL